MIIQEMEEKNHIMYEVNSLLKEKVVFLEKEIITLNQKCIPAKTINWGNSFKNNTRNTTNRVGLKQIATEEMCNNIQKSEQNTDGNMKYDENTSRNKNNISIETKRKIMTEIIHLEENNGNSEENHPQNTKISTQDNEFTTVTYKKRKPTPKYTVYGEGINQSLKAAPRLGYLHVYGLHPEVKN